MIRALPLLALALASPAYAGGLHSGPATPGQTAWHSAWRGSSAASAARILPPWQAPAPNIAVPELYTIAPPDALASNLHIPQIAPDMDVLLYGLAAAAVVGGILLLTDGGESQPEPVIVPPATSPPTPGQFNFPPPAIPEPATWAMLLLGFLTLGAVVRRNRKECVG